MTLPCDGNVCFVGSEPDDSTSTGIAEVSSIGSDIDRQIESIRASLDSQVLSIPKELVGTYLR